MRKIRIPSQYFEMLVGKLDENLKALEKALGVRASARGDEVFIEASEEKEAETETLINKLLDLLENGYTIANGDVKTAAALLQQDPDLDLKRFFLSSKISPSAKKTVYPRSFNQKKYIE